MKISSFAKKNLSLLAVAPAFCVAAFLAGCNPDLRGVGHNAVGGAAEAAPEADGARTAPESGDGVRIAAWNMKWFPSGHPVLRDEDRNARQEYKRIDSAARFIAWQRADVVMLEEVRNREVCEALCENEALPGWSVSAVTAFAAAKDATIPPHQNAIVSRFAPLDAGWQRWKADGDVTPPRGFVWAVFDFNGTLCGVIGVHLKSNYIPQDAEDKESLPAQNRRMREASARQLAAFARELLGRDYSGRRVAEVVVGGDFNTSIFDSRYDGERTIPEMLSAGFADCFDGVMERNTMPESKWYPATCFDYLFAKGPAEFFGPVVAPKSWTSDHQMISAIFAF